MKLRIAFEISLIFLVLFFPGLGLSQREPGAFSPDLVRLGLYVFPGLALIGFFLLQAENRPFRPSLKAGPRDLLAALLCLAALCLIALGFQALSRLAPELPSPPLLVKPSGAFSWFVLVLFYLASGYLEEGYFRIYLEARLGRAGCGPLARLLLSSCLFALCHLYQGLPGFCNAFVSGIFLLFFYRKTRLPHGLALGHGLYNILAYVLS
ncbi:MAG: CPBP family intramembrane metalloprotease [Spirochaetaceae bacterium]|jgi:hypothetical protein|nr:CPBP family intramembrane metalloprotease [Spirochaetaceae bacterium]